MKRTFHSISNVIRHPVYYFSKWLEEKLVGDKKATAEIFGGTGENYGGAYLGNTKIFLSWPRIFIKDYGYFQCPRLRFVPKKDIERIRTISALYQQKIKSLEQENKALQKAIQAIREGKAT